MSYFHYQDADIHYEYVQSEKTQSETLVLAHGLGLNLKTWNYLIPLLKDYNILTFDFRGHGKTRATLEQANWDILYHDFKALTSHLNIENYHFIGHGHGALFGIELASIYHEPIDSLTIIGGPLFFPEDIAEEAITYRKNTVANGGLEALAKLMLPLILHNVTEEKKHLLNNAYNSIDQDYYFKLLQLNSIPLAPEKLQSIDVPTLNIGGECDPTFPPALVTMSTKYFPRGKTAIVINSSNVVQMDQPEILSRLFKMFVETNDTSESIGHDSEQHLPPYVKQLDDYLIQIPLQNKKSNRKNKYIVKINLLYKFEVTYDGVKIDGSWNQRSAKELLAFLAINGVALREQLFEVFWPELPLTNAQNQLRVALSNLRKILTNAGIKDAITSNKRDLHLAVEYECDVIDLKELLKQGMAATDYYSVRKIILKILEIINLSHQELFPDLYFDWIFDLKLFLEEQIIYLFMRTYPELIEHGEYIIAKQMLETLLKFKPYDKTIKKDFYEVNEKVHNASFSDDK